MESRNNIHFVFVGRMKDSQILLAAITNPLYSKNFDFQTHANVLLQK